MQLLKIGDFSQLGQVSVRTLRLYDEIGLLKLTYIDNFSGYRFYSVSQLPRLNRIIALKNLGFSLKQVADLMQENLSIEELRGMLKLKQATLEIEIEEQQLRLAQVETRLRQIESEGALSPYEVILKEVPAMWIASISSVVPDLNSMVQIRCELFSQLHNQLKQEGLKPAPPELALYDHCEYTEENIRLEAAVALEANPSDIKRLAFVRQLPAVSLMASVVHHGRFQDVGNAITTLYTWLSESNYQVAGAYRELHLFGYENEWHDMNDVTLEMQLPLKAA